MFVGNSVKGDNVNGNKKFGRGNTILVHIKGNRYCIIGPSIFEFSIPKNDEITKFFSMIGNSDIPYPVAVGNRNVYYLEDGNPLYLSKSHFDGFPKKYNWGLHSYARLEGQGVFSNKGGPKKYPDTSLEKYAKKISLKKINSARFGNNW